MSFTGTESAEVKAMAPRAEIKENGWRNELSSQAQFLLPDSLILYLEGVNQVGEGLKRMSGCIKVHPPENKGHEGRRVLLTTIKE